MSQVARTMQDITIRYTGCDYVDGPTEERVMVPIDVVLSGLNAGWLTPLAVLEHYTKVPNFDPEGGRDAEIFTNQVMYQFLQGCGDGPYELSWLEGIISSFVNSSKESDLYHYPLEGMVRYTGHHLAFDQIMDWAREGFPELVVIAVERSDVKVTAEQINICHDVLNGFTDDELVGDRGRLQKAIQENAQRHQKVS